MKLKKLAIAVGFFALGSAPLTLSGCDSAPDQGGTAPEGTAETAIDPGNASTGNPAGGGTSGGAKTAATVGESCDTGNDPNRLCLGIHWVTYTSSGTPTTTTAQAATIIHKMNQVWAACNISFQIEKYEAVNPANYGLAYGASSQSQTDTIRSTFGSNDMLLSVTTGPWGTAVNGWTNMPGDNVYGAIMEASIVTYGDGMIYAHEFGHYLGLDHVSNTGNLMNPVIYTSSTTLSASQCQTARQVSQSYWASMLRS